MVAIPIVVSNNAKLQQPDPRHNGQLQITIQSWQMAAQKVEYPIFRPTYLPDGLTPGWPSYDQQTGAVVQNYSSGQDASALILIQRPTSDAPKNVPGRLFQIGTSTSSYWKRESRQWLFLDQATTRIELQASLSVKKDSLLRFAESLQPVPLP
jgi:hypothetical protein